MSNEVFPSNLPGLKWDQVKTPIFHTRTQRAVSGREYRAQDWTYPLWRYELSYELLRDDTAHNELKTIVGFYLRHGGAAQSFLFQDGDDYQVANQAIGTGDGNTVAFQMVRTFGNFTEPVYEIQPASNSVTLTVYVSGNAQNANNYTISYNDNGTLTFGNNSKPANGAAVTATFSFWRRVRFEEYGEGDEAFKQFMRQLWEAQKVVLVQAR